MAKPLRVLNEAVAEARKAWLWYRQRSTRAAGRFQQAFEQAIEVIQEHPDRAPEYLHRTRCAMLKKFPYIIVYRELDDELQIVAVAHMHRRQAYWKKRLK